MSGYRPWPHLSFHDPCHMPSCDQGRECTHEQIWPTSMKIMTWMFDSQSTNMRKRLRRKTNLACFFFFFLTRGWRFQNLKSVKMDFKRLLLHAVQHPRCFEHDGRLSIDILMLKWLLPATVERLARPARVEVGWRQTQTQIWPQRHRIVLECDKSDLFSLLL